MTTRTALVFTLGLAACAGPLAQRRDAGGGADARAAWRALVEGRPDEAARGFDARLATAPDDVLARFGRATLAYDRGDGPRALDDYTAVLVATARAATTERREATAALVAPVAAARALALDDDLGPSRRARDEATLLALPDGDALPWQARLELARLADHVARRAGDAVALEREAVRRGCARDVGDAGVIGPLAHLDLDRSATTPPRARWAPVLATGCRLSVSARDGRPAAERLRAAVDVPGGTYDLVLDYDGDARLAIDDAPPMRHGSETRFGPRVSAFAVALTAGRHEIELRLATEGGRADVSLLLLPRASGAGVRFEAASEGGARAHATVLPPPSATPALDDALDDYARAFVADRAGDVDEALTRAARLAGRRGFAPGLTLAALVSRDDPTRPAGFTRDNARGLLRAALAVDGADARAWQTLAAVELEDEHVREAIDDAQAAARGAPAWWAPEVVLAHALRARGLEWDADRALDRAATKGGPPGDAPCALLETLLRRAEDERALATQTGLEDALVACDATSEARVDRLRARGDLPAAAEALRAMLRVSPDRDDLTGELAQVEGAAGQGARALATVTALVAGEPLDPFLRVRLADAQAALGRTEEARASVREALVMRPEAAEIRRAARALALPLPLDAYRVDGAAVIRAFEAKGRRYAAPAVVVLDRTVERVFPDGAQMTLTHEIVRVQSKDAIDHWAEVDVPPGADVLTLRTHKPDGTTREPEEISGKETISAANVAIGDYIEWETLETRGASGAFAPGFLADRFYFQSFDAPLDRTELVLVTPPAMKLAFDSRAHAPAPRTTTAVDGAVVTTFATGAAPQLFAERSAVPAIEYVPSVRASSALAFDAWTRYVEEQLYGTTRTSPALRERARQLAEAVGPTPRADARLAAAVVSWVTENVEASDDLRDGATQTLARGSGNRLALMLALLRELGVPARPVLARSRLVAEADAPTPVEELDAFSDSILAIDLPGSPAGARVFVDPRLRHAAFGYLPPSLDGARTLALDDGRFGVARSTGTADHRSVDVTIRLDDQGGGVAVATEELTGWPALEWAELVEKFGADRARLRQDFEQRWLGVQFPGARLRDLDVTLPKDAPGAAVGPVHVRYSFTSPQLAVKGDHEMKLLPTFFRSQPGRRFATEPQRATTLVLGFDVPFHLTATVELPRSAKLDEPTSDERVERKGAYRFVEERSRRAGATDVLVLTRESSLPLSRVVPRDYAGVAADLRRVDGLEQQEIHIRLHGARGAQ
ncbi:MAG TPA: hypothetical protein VLA14_09035 [Polyangia bacterium]|nr:hypothetical protein [Polyangia bacterium]